MTGFLIIVRGFSLRKESTIAVFRIFVSVSAFDFTWDARSMVSLEESSSKCLAGEHQQMLENGTKAQCREESERAHNQYCADEQNREERPGHWESAERCWSHFLSREIAGDRENRNHYKKSSQQHGDGGACVVPGGVRVQTTERGAIVSDRRCVGVENLREAMRARI